MSTVRHLIIAALITAIAAPAASAQAPGSPFRIDPERYALQQTAPPVAAQLHPAAKGALIGGAVGAAAWLGIGLWYCTVGPNEVGECSSGHTWVSGIPLFTGVGAAVGALIGAAKSK
jgi:hypothetical protein